MMSKLPTLLISCLVGCQPAQASTSQASTNVPGAPQAPQHPLSTNEVAPEGQSSITVDEEQVMMEQAFDAQPFDESWRGPREARLRSAFAELKDGTSLDSVECRQTLCKLVVRGSGRRHGASLRGAITDAFNDKDGFMMQHSFVVYGSEDRSKSTVYVSRNHYTLPDRNGVTSELPKKTGKPNP